MKRNKLMKNLLAGFLAGTMVLSMGGMTAFAIEGEGDGDSGTGSSYETSISFTKEVTTDGNSFAPATTFTFDVSIGDAKPATFNGENVEQGVEGGLTAGNAVFAPGAETNVSYIENVQLTTDATKFPEPGIYHYVLKEKNTGYEGITYDPTEYHVYVYVYRNADTNEKYVDGIRVTRNEGSIESTDKVSDLKFVNDYDKGSKVLKDVTIKKLVSGNQSSLNDGFTFNITVNGQTSEKFKAVITRADADHANSTKDTITLVDDVESEAITLYGNDYITIYGLSASDTYTVVENETSSKELGYKETKVQIGEGNATVGYEAENVSYDNNVVFTNIKNVGPATGIAMTFAPYAVMVAFAGVFAVMFLRKKKEDF